MLHNEETKMIDQSQLRLRRGFLAAATSLGLGTVAWPFVRKLGRLEQLAPDELKQLIGTTFRVRVDENWIRAELVDVAVTKQRNVPFNVRPYSALLEFAPVGDGKLPRDGSYPCSHSHLSDSTVCFTRFGRDDRFQTMIS